MKATDTRNVPFFRYSHVFLQRRDEVVRGVLAAAESGAFILQSEVRRFEEWLAEYCGADHCVGVGNATDGLELILQAMGVGAGDEVLLPSHTFIASAAAVVRNGGTPVLAEIGEDHLLDWTDLEHRITSRTKAIMPTQLNGRSAEMDRLEDVTTRHGLLLLEDSAQALGSRFRGRMAGTFGAAGVFSFYPAKTLGCLGDGGAIVTDDEALADELRSLRDHGRNPATGDISCWGRNSRLDNLQAAVLLAKAEWLDEEIQRRRELARCYHRNLCHRPELRLPPAPAQEDGHHFDTFQNYEIEAVDREELRRHLAESGVGTLLQWGGKGVHQHEALQLVAKLPRTEAILERAMLLPMNTSLSDDEVDYVCEQIDGFYARVP